MHPGYVHHEYMHHGYMHQGYMHHGCMHHGHMHWGYMYHGCIIHARNSAFNMEQPRVNNKAFSHHSKPRLAIVWNQLPESVKSGPLQTFKRDLKEYYFSRYNSECEVWDCQTCHGRGWIFLSLDIHMYFVHTHAQKYRLSTTVNCQHCISTLKFTLCRQYIAYHFTKVPAEHYSTPPTLYFVLHTLILGLRKMAQ